MRGAYLKDVTDIADICKAQLSRDAQINNFLRLHLSRFGLLYQAYFMFINKPFVEFNFFTERCIFFFKAFCTW